MTQITAAKQITAGLGLASVGLFLFAFLLCSFLNPDFHLLCDYISKLGASQQPYAIVFNVIGFAMVGMTFAMFGYSLGVTVGDRVLGTCLASTGVAFALAAIPTDLSQAEAVASRLHFAAVCLGLGGWCIALARLSQLEQRDTDLKLGAGLVTALAIVPILCVGGGVSSEPVAQRFLLLLVFCWVIHISLRLFAHVDEDASIPRQLPG